MDIRYKTKTRLGFWPLSLVLVLQLISTLIVQNNKFFFTPELKMNVKLVLTLPKKKKVNYIRFKKVLVEDSKVVIYLLKMFIASYQKILLHNELSILDKQKFVFFYNRNAYNHYKIYVYLLLYYSSVPDRQTCIEFVNRNTVLP